MHKTGKTGSGVRGNGGGAGGRGGGVGQRRAAASSACMFATLASCHTQNFRCQCCATCIKELVV